MSVPNKKSDLKALTSNSTIVPLLSDSISFLSSIDQAPVTTQGPYVHLLSSLYSLPLITVTSSALTVYRILIKLTLTRLQ